MKEYVLAEHGRTQWRIVMPHPAHETVKFACDELQKFVLRMSGAALPVQTELVADGAYEILVGKSGRLAHYGIQVDWDSLGEEGYVVRASDHCLLLAGATPRGTLYAVYAFLEEQLGCRWFASDCARIPKKDRVTYDALDKTDRPAFESREAYWRDAFDGDFAVRNRMNGNKARIGLHQGGRMKFYNFHHSFDDLIPPREWYDSHPEYFSQVKGKRLKEYTQLCLTNPDVLRLCIARVKQWIRQNPDCRVFSVAQNDWDNHCTCPDCSAIDEREGSPAGTMITFVNQLAEEVEREFPDVLIHTFAYQYTRRAPRFVRPRKNVIVRLCSIECCFSHPLNGVLREPLADTPYAYQGGPRTPECASAGQNRFLRDLQDWSKITPRLYVWDYVTQFASYLLPMPNFDVLKSNLQLFRDLGVKGVLEQGNFSHGGGGHLAELEAYLQAKLMWNPDADMDAHMIDFLNGYYGNASAPFVRQYIQLWQQAVRPYHITIFENEFSGFVTDELIEKSMELLGEAMFHAQDGECSKRISKLQTSMNYVLICRMPIGTPGRNALISQLAWQLRKLGIDEIHERWTLDETIAQMRIAQVRSQQVRTIVNDYKM